MANPVRGETAFEADGKTYTLRFSANAICEMEEALGRGIGVIGQEMGSMETARLTTVRAVFWAGLRDHHPDIDLKAAGDLVMAAGGIVGALALISKAFELAFPVAKTKGARPPRGRAGTGPG